MNRKLQAAPLVLAAPLMLVAVLVAAVISGCQTGPTAEEQITEGVTEQFEALKASDSGFVAEMTDLLGDSMEQLGVDSSAWVESYFEGFDYSIDEIEIDDEAGTAEVSVTVTSKDLKTILNSFYEQYYAQSQAGAYATDEAASQGAGQILMDVTAGAAVRDVDCALAYTRDDEGTWSADEDDVSAEIYSAMFSQQS